MICNEEFERIWDVDVEEWMLVNCAESEPTRAREPDENDEESAKKIVSLVHFTCQRESSVESVLGKRKLDEEQVKNKKQVNITREDR